MATDLGIFNLEDINFELDTVFVIKLEGRDEDWFLERIEFGDTDDLVREIYWTQQELQALHFHDYEDVLSFASSQFGGRSVSIKEII